MATKKSITVPQNGTQPAKILSPIDNMISGSYSKRETKKKPTSFSLDTELFNKFKAHCASKGESMSSIIEGFMLDFINKI